MSYPDTNAYFWPIYNAYNAALAQNQYTDWRFQNMINQSQMQYIVNPVNYGMLNMDSKCVNSYPVKKRLTLDDMYKLAFPFDPIRVWSEKKCKEIEKKYAKYC